jgi:phage major head subunit gpT-like protein
MHYVLTRVYTDDIETEVLAIRSNKWLAKRRLMEIAVQMVAKSQKTEPLVLVANEDKSEINLIRSEYANEEPICILNLIPIKDVV